MRRLIGKASLNAEWISGRKKIHQTKSKELSVIRKVGTLLACCAVAAADTLVIAGTSTEAAAGARVLSGNVIKTKPIVRNAPTLRNAQSMRITARSLGKTPGQKLCQRTPSGGYSCTRVN